MKVGFKGVLTGLREHRINKELYFYHEQKAQRLGLVGKKLRIESKDLEINDKNLKDLPVPVRRFIWRFLDATPVMEAQTSGSTGAPKKIVIRKDHMRASAAKTLEFLRLREGDKALLCLSAEHIAGIMMLVRWIGGGLDLYPVEPLAKPLEHQKGRFDFAAMVPYQVYHSLDQVHRVKKLIIGGGALDAELEDALVRHPGEVYHTYGMTETLSHVAMRLINGPQREDCYRAMPGVHFSLDERGCLVIDAPDIGVQKLATNDVAELVNGHSFRWLGRYDNVVNSGGVKLHPERIEKKIGGISRDFIVAGIPDAALGQKLVLIIESGAGSEISELNSRLAHLDPYEKPREIFFVPEFARTANGKLKRGAIVEQALTEP